MLTPQDGSELRRWRESLRIPPDALARKIDTAPSYLREVEGGTRRLTPRFARRAVRGLAELNAEFERTTAEIRRLLSDSMQ